MNEENIIDSRVYPAAAMPVLVDRRDEIMNQMADLMPKMMAALKENNERLAQLEREMRLTVTLNRRQCTDLTERIRKRAQEIAAQWSLRPGAEKIISTEIRRALRAMTGVTALQDMPGCDYETYQEVIQTWDDYKIIKNLR